MARVFTDEVFEIPYRWLADNGIDEWLPDNPIIRINLRRKTLDYTCYVFHGPRGWDVEGVTIRDRAPLTGWRRVRLARPPTPQELDAITIAGCAVITSR